MFSFWCCVPPSSHRVTALSANCLPVDKHNKNCHFRLCLSGLDYDYVIDTARNKYQLESEKSSWSKNFSNCGPEWGSILCFSFSHLGHSSEEVGLLMMQSSNCCKVEDRPKLNQMTKHVTATATSNEGISMQLEYAKARSKIIRSDYKNIKLLIYWYLH